ncbi:CBL-interacting serine/threonine-protein kinase 24-like [Arachis duranensis]|uniref:CBL-interacting serine/threonine-protein kinase 24-like n=1 Tax=Arachis duranensis TaxID=130453 RepID=A0A9C6WUG4_ARADU|nr:CBL-interacting serine/threonine-protein kinase 24-like [Arachis duranensis]
MIVKGLSHIHRKGIVHCDLKPENILVFPSLDKEIANYQLKIANFGLSKTKEEKTDVELWKSKPRGMPSYLSPEAFSGHIDAPMDIWALGCIVIEMLTGLPGFAYAISVAPECLPTKRTWGSLPFLFHDVTMIYNDTSPLTTAATSGPIQEAESDEKAIGSKKPLAEQRNKRVKKQPAWMKDYSASIHPNWFFLHTLVSLLN